MKNYSVVVSVLLSLGGTQAYAQDNLDWVGTNSSNWFLASNWDIAGPGVGHVPTQNDFATILATSPNALIDTGQTASARGLTIDAGGTLFHTNGTLNVAATSVTNGLVVNGAYNFGLGAAINPSLNVHGVFIVNSGGLFRNDRGTHVQVNNTQFQVGGTYQLFTVNSTLDARAITLVGSGRLEYLAGSFSSTGLHLQDTASFEIGGIVTAAIIGDYTQASGSTLEISFDSSTFGAEQLSVIGTAAVAGNLDLGSYTSGSVGATVTILQAGELQGEFDSILDVSIAGTTNFGWSLEYVYNVLEDDRLDAEIRLLGDANGDQYVGLEDLDVVLARWGDTVAAGVFDEGDFNGDGTVGSADLTIILDNYGASAPASTVNVPEPGSLILVSFGGIALSRRRYSTPMVWR